MLLRLTLWSKRLLKNLLMAFGQYGLDRGCPLGVDLITALVRRWRLAYG
jgi:hypothetical protein